MHLYDRHWHHLGTKETLAAEISDITKVPIEVLVHRRNPGDYGGGEVILGLEKIGDPTKRERIYAYTVTECLI